MQKGRILTQPPSDGGEPLSLALSLLRGTRELASRLVVVSRRAHGKDAGQYALAPGTTGRIINGHNGSRNAYENDAHARVVFGRAVWS